MPARSRVAVVLVAAWLVAEGFVGAPDNGAIRSPGMRPAVAASIARVPVGFVPNRDLADPWASDLALGDTTAVLFGPGGLSFRRSHRPSRADDGCVDDERLEGCAASAADDLAPPPPDPLAPMTAGERAGDAERGTVDALDLRFVGARAGVAPVAEAPTGATLSRFSGPRAMWRAGLTLYGRLVYRDAWPGIDVVWEGAPHRLKHTFVVRPGADPAAIGLAWHGARGLRVNADGSLEVDAPGGPLRDAAPVAWQLEGGRRRVVPVAYDVSRPPVEGGLAYGFRLGAHDPSATLTIDPAIVVSASFLGSEERDRGLGVALGPEGHIYVCGRWGGAAFVARLTPDGGALDWMALIDAAAAFDIDVDRTGRAVVTGATSSWDGTFPASRGPDLTFNGGANDGFVARLAPDGADLEWSGFFGGAGVDFGEGIAVDDAGYVTVEGIAGSTERTFPVVVGPDLTHNGRYDVWVGRIRPEPFAERVEDNYAWSGFIGGSGDDVVNRVVGSSTSWSSGHVALDSVGNAYVSGQTNSMESTFPDGDGFGSLPGPDRTYNGQMDAWIAKVRADGTGLDYAGYIGGDRFDTGKGMAVDARGAAWLTGSTRSDERTFPIVGGPGRVHGGEVDAFVARVRPDGTGLEQSGYLGGDDDDGGQAVALAPDGALIVVGSTESNEDYFPVVVGPDLTHNGPQGLPPVENEDDAFIGRLSPRGAPDGPWQWDFVGYLGGAGTDSAFWVAVAPDGRSVVVGDTESDEGSFPDGDGLGALPGLGAPYHGARDAFVAVVAWEPPPPRAFLPWSGRGADLGSAPTSVPAPTGPSPTATTTRLPTSTAAPTVPPPVRRPTPEPGPPPGEGCLFVDDFEDPASGWPVVSGDAEAWRYVFGQYEVALQPGRYAAPAGPDVPFGDGAFEATVEIVEEPGARAGLHIGLPSAHVSFIVSGEGRYEVVKRYGSGFRALWPATLSEHVYPLGTPNRLRVEVDGPRMAVFANGHYLTAVEDPAITELGQAGFLVRNSTDSPAVARFDDVVVTCWLSGRPSPTPLPPTVMPTQTPTRAPTPTVVLPPCEELVFADDFADPRSGWPVQGEDTYNWRYVEGQYEVLVEPGRYSAPRRPGIMLDEGAFEATVQLLENPQAKAGLRFGPVGAFLGFNVSGDGRYQLDLRTADAVRSIVPPTSSEHLRLFGSTNRLRVEIDGSRATLMANGHVLRVVDNPAFLEAGEVGFSVRNGTDARAVARFDDAVVTRWLPCRPSPTPPVAAAGRVAPSD